MRPVVALYDEFFEDEETARQVVLAGEFVTQVSPIDGVAYPGINADIPFKIRKTVIEKLESLLDEEIDPVVMFARLTTKRLAPAPHRIHSDKIMGEYSAHVYLSREWPEGAGTSFWQHKSEGFIHTDQTDLERIKRDQNSTDQWNKSLVAQGAFNRVLIHDARFWHSAEPVGGWGEGPLDGRVVLTCFFNRKRGAA